MSAPVSGLASRWFVRAKSMARAKRRMLCFHHAGGAASMFRRWHYEMGGVAEIVAVQLPGREGRFGEVPLNDANTLISLLLPEIREAAERPYVLFGHSLGALIAAELAARLDEGGARRPDAVIVSGQRPPQRRNAAVRPRSALPDEELLALITSYDGTAAEILDNRELTQLLLPRFRSDFRLAESMPAWDGRLLSVPLLVLGGTDDKIVPADDLPAWRETTAATCEIALFPGGHFFLSDATHVVCQRIARFIEGLC